MALCERVHGLKVGLTNSFDWTLFRPSLSKAIIDTIWKVRFSSLHFIFEECPYDVLKKTSKHGIWHTYCSRKDTFTPTERPLSSPCSTITNAELNFEMTFHCWLFLSPYWGNCLIHSFVYSFKRSLRIYLHVLSKQKRVKCSRLSNEFEKSEIH